MPKINIHQLLELAVVCKLSRQQVIVKLLAELAFREILQAANTGDSGVFVTRYELLDGNHFAIGRDSDFISLPEEELTKKAMTFFERTGGKTTSKDLRQPAGAKQVTLYKNEISQIREILNGTSGFDGTAPQFIRLDNELLDESGNISTENILAHLTSEDVAA